MKSNLIASSALTAAALIGGAVGFVAASKIAEKKLQKTLDEELEKAKVLYQRMYSTPVFEKAPEGTDEDQVRTDTLDQRIRAAVSQEDPMPEDLVGKALNAARTYEAADDEEEREEEKAEIQPQIVNLFDRHIPPGEEVLDALLQDRDPSAPYIITKEEFLNAADDVDFEQKSFTFYEGDAILVDDQDEYNPIQNTNMVAGDQNLRQFGYGSGDEYVLYVRNETLDPPLDLHITKSSGKYAVEVMALDDDEPHLQHSRPQKFRLRDE